jgi:hypothetical protein
MSACRISRQWLVARCAARCRHGRLLKRLDARTGAQVYARLHRDPEHEIETEVDHYIAWRGQALSYYLGELAIVRQLCLELFRRSCKAGCRHVPPSPTSLRVKLRRVERLPASAQGFGAASWRARDSLNSEGIRERVVKAETALVTLWPPLPEECGS